VPELLDIQPYLDRLQLGAEQAKDARSKCLEVINQNFERGSEIAATVAGRLQEYRDAKIGHSPTLVKMAESAEVEVTAWLPVLVAAQEIVASVAVDEFVTVGRSAISALVAHRKTAEKTRDDVQRIVAFSELLSNAPTNEARVEILLRLSDNDLETFRNGFTHITTSLNEELVKLGGIAEHEIAVSAAIAETLGATREFLEARQQVLENYLKATDYFRGLEPKVHTASEATRRATKETAKIGIEFVATKAGPKVFEQVPVVGLVIAGIDLVLEMRKKRDEFHRRAEELWAKAAALRARNETDEIDDLGLGLANDIQSLADLKELVRVLDQSLRRPYQHDHTDTSTE
jgi:hypothetical protein